MARAKRQPSPFHGHKNIMERDAAIDAFHPGGRKERVSPCLTIGEAKKRMLKIAVDYGLRHQSSELNSLAVFIATH